MLFTALGTQSVSAFNSNSGYREGPGAYAGAWSQGETFALKTAYTPVTGTEVSTYFKNYGWLRDGVCVESNTRELTVELWEEDYLNDDDHVKTYRGSFQRRQLTEIHALPVVMSGNIEADNDPTAELYIKLHISYVQGDKTTTNGGLFMYDIRVD